MSKSTLDVRKDFLNRKKCLEEARRLIIEGRVSGMSEEQLASEIYFHAAAYYFCKKTGLLPRVKSHAHPIDLHDGGDMLRRRIVYSALWRFTGLNIRRKNGK